MGLRFCDSAGVYLQRRGLAPPSIVYPQALYYRGPACPDYGDKRPRNKRIGPGGGTRRLHQVPTEPKPGGQLWGRNRIDGRVKVVLSPGMVSAVIGLFV